MLEQRDIPDFVHLNEGEQSDPMRIYHIYVVDEYFIDVARAIVVAHSQQAAFGMVDEAFLSIDPDSERAYRVHRVWDMDTQRLLYLDYGD
jgi:hypothetical protein